MENIIQIKININCDLSNAFKLFTINELLESWLTEKAEVEPKVGGVYELFWDPKNREINSTIGCKITGIEVNKFISFEWKGPVQFQQFMNVADPLTHVIVFFSQDNNEPDRTNVYLFHTGWRNDDKWKNARDYFEKAWMKALEGLQKKVNNNSIFCY